MHCRGYSLPLQRAITDFGSEKSFDRASGQMLEHYNLIISASTIRRVTEGHGHQIQINPELIQGKASETQTGQHLIVETDGTMIPIVKTDEGDDSDNRKNRVVCWKEARLGLVYEQGSTTPIFGASTEGVEKMGDQLECCATVLGLDKHTQIHGVGDGATWIPDQINRVFGTQSSYLIDFFHLSDYLAAASKSCAEDHVIWLKEQQEQLKKGNLDAVVEAMKFHDEPLTVKDQDAPVRACLRYIQNRPGQFDYLKALQAELPIGSGQIESAHRYVIKERMNLAGAWWKFENAGDMIGLRTLRANDQWDNYWNTCQAL